MKFGMNMLLWTGNITDEHLPGAGKAQEDGLRRRRASDLRPRRRRSYQALGQAARRRSGLERTAVTCRRRRRQPDQPRRQNARRRRRSNSRRVLDCCQAAGVQDHGGPYHSALGEFTGTGPTADEWKWGVESMQHQRRAREKVRRDAGGGVSEPLRVLSAQLRRPTRCGSSKTSTIRIAA